MPAEYQSPIYLQCLCHGLVEQMRARDCGWHLGFVEFNLHTSNFIGPLQMISLVFESFSKYPISSTRIVNLPFCIRIALEYESMQVMVLWLRI